MVALGDSICSASIGSVGSVSVGAMTALELWPASAAVALDRSVSSDSIGRVRVRVSVQVSGSVSVSVEVNSITGSCRW